MSGAYHLVASSADQGKRWEMPLPENEKILLGRKPSDGLAVPWDAKISSEHAELELSDGVLKVNKLKSARNAIHFENKSVNRCEIAPGEHFRIGRTRFELVQIDPQLQKLMRATDRYRIRKKIGVGPTGHVYAARDQETTLPVAIKVFHPELASHPKLCKRVLSQAEKLRHVEHANVARVIEADIADGVLFQVTEFVPGKDLARLVAAKGPLSLRRSVEIVEQVLRGIEHLHEHGLTHRNLKPSNILTRVGTMKLTDFGLDLPPSWLAETEHGTVDYLSPEQAESRRTADLLSEFYSLGCIWYFLITGQPPFPESTITAKLQAHVAKQRPDPSLINSRCGPRLTRTITALMAADPQRRPQTPDEVRDLLKDPAMAGLSIVCEHCGAAYAVNPKYSGRTLPCKQCDSPIRIPTVLE